LGLHQFAPGVLTHHTVGDQAVPLLKHLHCPGSILSEKSIDAIGADIVAHTLQPGLDIKDFLASVCMFQRSQ
jgi:hypothetical protein